MCYSSDLLRKIGKDARMKPDKWPLLQQHTRAIIIALGIKKQPLNHPYRRSRGGKKLFHRIESIISSAQMVKNHIRETNLKHLIPVQQIHKLPYRELNITHVNIWSITSKIHQLQQVITLENCDVCAVTETWIKSGSEDEEFVTKSIPPEGYKFFSHPRLNGRTGWGTALIYKSNINIEEKSGTTRDLLTMEYHDYKVCFKSLTLNLYVIYRFPNTSVLTFCTELATILERNILDMTGKLVLLGDFNMHMDVVDDTDMIISITSLTVLTWKTWFIFQHPSVDTHWTYWSQTKTGTMALFRPKGIW